MTTQNIHYRDFTTKWNAAAKKKLATDWELKGQKTLEKDLSSLKLVHTARILSENPWALLPENAHKYDRGHVLVIGGSAGKVGAPLLCAMAALRGGAGWVTVAIAKADYHAGPSPEIPPELTFEDLHKNDGTIDQSRLETFLRTRRVRSIAVGMGWITNKLNAKILTTILTHLDKVDGNLTIDAAATQGLADLTQPLPKTLRPMLRRVIATPHVGEWSKMSEKSFGKIKSKTDLAKAVELTRVLGFNIFYKSSVPLLLSPDSKVSPIAVTAGNRTLARAGSGDILAGVISALGLSQLPYWFIACRAQCQVAKAADTAGKAYGVDSVIASDVIRYLGRI